MRGLDREACESSSHRHQVVGTPDMDQLQDPSEILEQWAQLIPEEAFEQCFQFDDLDALLENCSGLVDFSTQPPLVSTSDSGTPENSETMSQIVTKESTDDQTTFTTSSDSVGTSTLTSSGKRKCRERIMEAGGDQYDGVETDTQPKLSMKAGGQERHLRKRLPNSDKSTRYAIRTRTEVDIVDDGYRWRKYGQKPVKNSDHPRNYYRCTTPDCSVRKQVERCTENPSNVLTTYDGKHNHPKSASHSMRESSIFQRHTENVPSSAPVRPDDHGFLGPPRPPPTNYMSHTLMNHLVTGALPDTRMSWPKAPPQRLSQRDLNVIRAHQLFMLQYQSQYPFFYSMFNLMHHYSLAPPPFFDPSLASLTAQNYGMRCMAQANSDRCTAAISASASTTHNQQQASRSATVLSRAQHRLLRMQELMGENREK